jgi:UDP-3-O-acyl N-acetylglucosamine deacetylase
MSEHSFQKTLSRAVEIAGIGLHTGRPCRIRLRPNDVGEGIAFLCNGETIPARVEYLVSTRRAVTLGSNGQQVSTVEHVLAALYGLGITNAVIEVDGPEIPALDSSAAPFVRKMQEAGIEALGAETSFRKLAAPVWVAEKESMVLALPYAGLKLTYIGRFPGLGNRKRTLRMSGKVFAEEIAPARTMVLRQEIEGILAEGLGQGGSAENVVVLDEGKAPASMRFKDEPVRHKLLDLVGDLSLLGRPLQAHVIAVRSGHRMNLELVGKLVESRS